ncbi:MAG: VOC family protein [Myxococcota bacterium]
MAHASEHHHHAIDYIEIPVDDVAVAKEFYSTAFGWSFNDYGPDYAGIKSVAGAGEIGGLRKELATARKGTGVLVILFSKTLEESVRRVTAAGGRITTPPFDFPGGRRFHFMDPSGNELGVWAEK